MYWSRIDKGFFGLGRNKGILGFLGEAIACLPLNYYVLCVMIWQSNIPGGFWGYERFLSNARLIALENCSHWMQADCGFDVNENLEKFLEEL